MKYDFSIVYNDGNTFPELRVGDVVVYGNYRRALAKCNYEGELNKDLFNQNEKSIWLPLGKDIDSVMAWHGKRKYEGGVQMVNVFFK
jgi:hypothetical protein